MLVSIDWLKEYVKLPDHDQMVDRLTMTGLNHEGTQVVARDQQIDLEVTSNRSDCLGHIGVAREISVLFDNPLSIPDPEPATSGKAIDDEFDVEINCPDLCYRFTARLIRGVKIGPSPDWLVNRLATVGIESVNNVVDISNYVMLECGQPLHAFDYDKIQGKKIVVREPDPNEKMEAIDHRTYNLEPGMCVIADANRAVGLGGVMGGAETEVSESTQNLLVEAAWFNPMSIRATARTLKLFSAASFRFERTLNSANIDWASRRCCELILQLAGGELAPGLIDKGTQPPDRDPIEFRFGQIDRILGIKIPNKETVAILEKLGFAIQSSDDVQVTVVPPSWRQDVTREVDLIEEVGRIYGYENVPDDIAVPMSASVRSHHERVVQKVRAAMTSTGFNEAVTASLVPEEWSDSFSPWTKNPPLQSHQPLLGVLDTSWQNMSVNLLRRSIVPSLLEAFRVNEYKQNQHVHLFEIANVYLPGDNPLPDEPSKLAIVSELDFTGLKGVIESMVDLLNQKSIIDTRQCDQSLLDITRSAELLLNGVELGWMGEVSEEAKQLFRFRQPATVAELDMAVLIQHATSIALHGSISHFPSITRDFNFVVEESVRWGQLAASVRGAVGDLLESITYKETFRNPSKDGADKKRVLLSVVLRSDQATMTGEQAEEACQKIVEQCGKKHSASLAV